MKGTCENEEIFKIIKEYIEKNGISPTIREIVLQSNYKSTSTIKKKIDQLEKDGFITKNNNIPRSIRLSHSKRY